MKESKILRSAENPGAVLNTDREGLLAYKRQKKRFEAINTIEQENADLKDRLSRLEAAIFGKGATQQ